MDDLTQYIPDPEEFTFDQVIRLHQAGIIGTEEARDMLHIKPLPYWYPCGGGGSSSSSSCNCAGCQSRY